MSEQKTLASFLVRSTPIFNRVFENEDYRRYVPIELIDLADNLLIFVTYLDSSGIRNGYIKLEDAIKHKYVRDHVRLRLVKS